MQTQQAIRQTLPPVQGIWKTLIVDYTNGTQIKVPYFDHDESAGIGYRVAIEATSAKDALRRAEDIGIYFNGCDTGMDCSCCGDRWSDWMDESDGTETPTNGYGEDPIKGGWGIPSYIHYMDGRIEAVQPED